jgi:hypothetical protein
MHAVQNLEHNHLGVKIFEHPAPSHPNPGHSFGTVRCEWLKLNLDAKNSG